MSRRGWVLFGAMGLVWGVPYLLIRVAVGALSPASLVFLRTAIASAVLLPLAAARGELRPLAPRWPALLAYTLVEIAGPWLLLSDAERRLPSSLASLLIATVPVIGAVLAWLLGEERLEARRLLGLLAGLLGVAVLVGGDLRAGTLGAAAEVGLVALGYACGPLVIARYLADLPALGVVAASLALCALGYAPVAIPALPAHLPPAPVGAAVLTLGLLCTAVAFLLFFALIAEVGPVRATVITYVNPAVAVALGVTVLGEPLTPAVVAGFALIVAGSYLATRRPAPPRPQAPAWPAAAEAPSGPRRARTGTVRSGPVARRPAVGGAPQQGGGPPAGNEGSG